MSGDHHIYVVLTDTGTLFSRLIRLFTKDELNHVSIAFDEELKEVYSFGRKKQSNPFVAGFVKEDLNGILFKHTKCFVYKCKVSAKAYRNIRNRIKAMEQNPERYRYNFLGMMAVAFGIELRRKHAYFCSQFVATMLQDNGIHVVDKPPLFVKPGDFQHASELELLYHGKLQTYLGLDKELRASLVSFRTA